MTLIEIQEQQEVISPDQTGQQFQPESSILQVHLSTLLMRFDQRLQRKRIASQYVVGENVAKVNRNAVEERLNSDADEELRNAAVEAMQYIGKIANVPIHNGYCLVCRNVLNNPYILIKCGHVVLCEGCAQEMEKRSKTVNTSKTIECPECRCITKATKIYM